MAELDGARTRVLERLARYLAAVKRSHPVRVAIDGRTAAGKTTLADELVAPLDSLGRSVIRVEIDDFHRPRAERHGRHELPPWMRYYLDSYDYPAIRAALLLPLGPDGDRRYRRALFDSYHDVPIEEPPQLAPADAVVLIDGVFLCRPELDDLWDVRIFVAIDAAESLRRGPPRDQPWVGSVAVAAERYGTTYIPGEDHYLALVRPCERADVVIDNQEPVAPRLCFRHEPGSESE